MSAVTKKPRKPPTVKAGGAFGAFNRKKLIDQYFDSRGCQTIRPQEAWQHVYRLLLWADGTTGLAHCYESDKCQPGKPWYGRSLAFHRWLADALSTAPAGLANEIDWLFLRASDDLAKETLKKAAKLNEKALKQRDGYEGKGFPQPGEDPELIRIVREVIGDDLKHEPTAETWQLLVTRIRQYLGLQNKRKNLVGEGFEDVLTQVIQRSGGPIKLDVRTRPYLEDVAGFNAPKRGDKKNRVDVAIVTPVMRTLVTAKWSVRADREKQFTTDFAEYVEAERDRKPWEYVFVTNEFDPARLMRACDKLATNQHMFTHCVHINTDAVLATYRNAKENAEADVKESMAAVAAHVKSGRLISLEKWLEKLAA